MSRLRRRPFQQAVSFFAFQDIITALAGSLLIIVLASAWSRQQNPAPSAEAGHSRSEYEHLQQQNVQLRTAIQTASAQLENLRRQQKQHNLQAQQQKLQLHNQNQLQELEKVIAQRRKLRQQLEQENSRLKTQTAQLTPQQQQYIQLENSARELQQKLSDRQLRRKIADRKPASAILDCSRNSWLWSSQPGQWHQLGGRASSLPALEGWHELEDKLKNSVPAIRHLVIAVRPSAGIFAEALKNCLRQKFPQMEIVAEPLASETAGGLEL